MRASSLMDLSTVIPVVLALLMFFGSMVSAINTVESKNERIDTVLSLVQIVDRLTEAGVVTDQRFNEVINSLSKTMPVSFYVCVTSVDDQDYRNCPLKGAKPLSYRSYSPKTVINKINRRAFISSTFPITYQTIKDGIPFNEINKVLVIVWQGG